MTETGSTPAFSSKFCDVDPGPVADGGSCLNVEVAIYNGQQFLASWQWVETENKSVVSVSSVSGVQDPSSVNFPIQICTKFSVRLHYFMFRHCKNTQKNNRFHHYSCFMSDGTSIKEFPFESRV